MHNETRIHRFDLAAVIFTIMLPTVVTLVYFVMLANAPARIQQSAYVVGKAVQFTFPAVFVWLCHRYRYHQPGNPKPTSRQWIVGIGFGLLVVASMFVAWFAFLSSLDIGASVTTAIREKVSGMNLNTPNKFLALGLFYTICHSFLEEYYWRWFVFERLDTLVSTFRANLISSVGFAAHHVILLATFFGWESLLTWLFSLGVAFGGFVWAQLFHKSGKLSVPWVSHLIVDAGIFGLGYLIAFG